MPLCCASRIGFGSAHADVQGCVSYISHAQQLGQAAPGAGGV